MTQPLEFYRIRNEFYGWANEAEHYHEKAQAADLVPVLKLMYQQRAKAAAGHAMAYLGVMIEQDRANAAH